MFSENCFICGSKLEVQKPYNFISHVLYDVRCPYYCFFIRYISTSNKKEICADLISFRIYEEDSRVNIGINHCSCSATIKNYTNYYYNNNAEQIFNLFLKDKSLKKLLLIQ